VRLVNGWRNLDGEFEVLAFYCLPYSDDHNMVGITFFNFTAEWMMRRFGTHARRG
jgi:hypothetical protein